MAKRSSSSKIEGRWRIESMTEWDDEYLHSLDTPFIEFGPHESGDFQFGYVQGHMDYQKVTRDGKPAVEFSWEGNDESEQAFGRGWAILENDQLDGMFFFHEGENSGFVARRANPRKRAKRVSTILSAVLLVLSVWTTATADDVRKQAWEDLATYPTNGLSPLYEEVGRMCQQILTENRRWAMLPRPVSVVHARPDQPPSFEMHNGDLYNNEYSNNPKAIRWAVEQTWDGQFRLLYNSKLKARHGDELWMETDGFGAELNLLIGDQWASHRSLNRPYESLRINAKMAPAGESKWWMATRDGLYQFEAGALRLVEIPGWPGGAAMGVVSDPQGRAVTWSVPSSGHDVTVAFFDQKQWTTLNVRHGTWKRAAIRADGSVVLAGQSQVIVVEPPAAVGPETKNEEQVGSSQEELEHAGHIPWGDDWLQPLGKLAISPNGSFLFSARLSDNTIGLLRDLGGGRRTWIEWADAQGSQLTAAPDDGFVILSSGKLFTLPAAASEPDLQSSDGEILHQGRLLGCDRDGRVYLQRGRAILAFLPGQKPSASASPSMIVPRELSRKSQYPANQIQESPPVVPLELSLLGSAPSLDIQHDNYRYSDLLHSDLRVATDSENTAWFIRPDGTVMKWTPAQEEPYPAGDQLVDARLLWPGINGSMLVLLQQGRVAFVQDARKGEKSFTLADSLSELAATSYDALLAAAPRSSCDPRVDLRPRSTIARFATPWLAFGKSLYCSDGQRIIRIWARENDDDNRVQIICEGDFNMLGPLGGGQLLLAKIGERPGKITDWYTVEDPDGAAKIERVASPPRKQNAGMLGKPANYEGPWLLDSRGGLWLHQGFDRAYRIDSSTEWSMLKDFGTPRFEYPPGVVWAHRTARVFEGYEVSDAADFRRSCRPTYLEHLTPFTTIRDGALCLSPRGIVRIRFEQDDPERDIVVQSIPVQWNGTPVRYIGVSSKFIYVSVFNKYLLFLVERDSEIHLVQIQLPRLLPGRMPSLRSRPSRIRTLPRKRP